MESAAILEKAKDTSNTPYGWMVFPLLRSKVILGILGWVFGIIMGFGLFAIVASITIPYNYQHGILPSLVSTLLLAILLFIGGGSVWATIVDMRRLSQADKHIIVLTPDDFVKQEGDKIIHVPLTHVRHVTARGVRSAEPNLGSQDDIQQASTGENVIGFVFGRGATPSGLKAKRKRMRTPTSLAFVDSRTDQEVMVVTDEAYGDPSTIAAFLKRYAKDAQNIA